MRRISAASCSSGLRLVGSPKRFYVTLVRLGEPSLMKLMPIRDWGWIGINGLIGLLFLWLSSHEWIEPELKDFPGASGGGPIVFTLLVFWLLGPLMILNLVWLGIMIWGGKRMRDWVTSILLVGLMSVAWLCLVLFSASKL